MNTKIAKVREDISRAEKQMRELGEHLKTLKLRERQYIDEEAVRVLRNVAGKDGDLIKLLDEFRKSYGQKQETSGPDRTSGEVSQTTGKEVKGSEIID